MPSCGDKRKKTARICSKFQGLTQIFDYNIKTVLWIFTISHPTYVFKVKESTVDILTELPCLSDLENPSQLPV